MLYPSEAPLKPQQEFPNLGEIPSLSRRLRALRPGVSPMSHVEGALCSAGPCCPRAFTVTGPCSQPPSIRRCLGFPGLRFLRTELIDRGRKALHGVGAWLSVGCVTSDGQHWCFSYFPKLHFCWLFICLFTQPFPCGIQKG